MIEKILPSYVAWSDTRNDPLDATLFPEEEKLIVQAVEKRRKEFTTARWCARRALGELGLPPVPVLPGPRGEPRWPDGVVGSMTHCVGYRGAVVGRSSDVTTIGIDAEPHGDLPEGTLNIIALPDERDHLRQLSRLDGGIHWERLLFCAKESIYKAWYPHARRWLDFSEARVRIDPGAGTFSARLLVPGPVVNGAELTGFSGRWMVADDIVLTTIVVPAAS